MTNLERRLRKLEAVLTDSAGLVPHTQKWLEYWDRQLALFIADQLPEPVLFPYEAIRAVIQYCDNPNSLVGRMSPADDPC